MTEGINAANAQRSCVRNLPTEIPEFVLLDSPAGVGWNKLRIFQGAQETHGTVL